MSKNPHIPQQHRKVVVKPKRRKKNPLPKDGVDGGVHVYNDDSYKDKRKRVFSHGLKEAKERIAAKNAVSPLTTTVNTVRQKLRESKLLSYLENQNSRIASFLISHFSFRPKAVNDRTKVLVINRDGRHRAFLPDKPGDHRILCHRCIARHLVSKVCMLVRITKNADDEGQPIDGSWAIVPAQYAMMRATTIQHLRRRRLFFLRRYWYEISFDGRVQPAHMLFDYNLDPEARKTRFYVTREYVPVRKQDATNDYFRFWSHKPTPPSNSTLTPSNSL